MRLRLGAVPLDTGFSPEESGWTRIREPASAWMVLLVITVSLLLAGALLYAWGALARSLGITGGLVVTSATAVVYILAFAAMIFLHELVHLLALPAFGFGAASTFGFWPRAFTPYVSYEGEIGRGRYVAVGLAPFLLLSLLPLLLCWVFSAVPTWALLLSTLNGFGSSADLIGVALVGWQVPSSGHTRSQGLATWWRRPASGGSTIIR